tara:strand:+ start:482 stop:655 length:174 start_codon:yes stop_codon:yes gene_type:complete
MHLKKQALIGTGMKQIIKIFYKNQVEQKELKILLKKIILQLMLQKLGYVKQNYLINI